MAAQNFGCLKKLTKNHKCVVVSAVGKEHHFDQKTTDLLAAHFCGDDTAWHKIEQKYKRVVQVNGVNVDVEKLLWDAQRRSKKHNLAYCLSLGEELSAKIAAAFLNCEYIEAQNCVKFDSSGRLLWRQTKSNLKSAFCGLPLGVIGGFYGGVMFDDCCRAASQNAANGKSIDDGAYGKMGSAANAKERNAPNEKSTSAIVKTNSKNGVLCSGDCSIPKDISPNSCKGNVFFNCGRAVFSRGGSDVTGAICAAATNSTLYENRTDVNGVFTANPRQVFGAKTIPSLCYAEMFFLAKSGAEVLHPDAVRFCGRFGIPICVCGFGGCGAATTLVSNCPSGAKFLAVTEKNVDEKIVTTVLHGMTFAEVSKKISTALNLVEGFGTKVLQVKIGNVSAEICTDKSILNTVFSVFTVKNGVGFVEL